MSDRSTCPALVLAAAVAGCADGATTFWIKGRRAMFESRELALVRCMTRPK